MKEFFFKNIIGIFGILIMLALGGGLAVVDYLSPSIDLVGKQHEIISYQGEYNEWGARASYRNENISDKIEIKGVVDTTKLGSYKIIYTVEHDGFNVQAVRIVDVVDNIEPIITLNGEREYNICPHREFEEPGYKASDNYDGDISDKVTVTIKDDKIIYKAKDSSNNVGVATRKINRVDNEAPVITLNGESTVHVPLGAKYYESGYTATDAFDLDINSKVKVTNTINTSKLGTYIIKYEVADCSGNTASNTRTVVVEKIDDGVNGTGSTIYLTFDDGPSGLTPAVLDILKEEGIKATFFVEGVYGADYGNMMKRIVAEGHTIGVHCYTHNYAAIYQSSETYFNDLYKARDVIKGITGVDSKIIRFPGGSSNQVSSKYSPGIMSYLVQEVQNRGFHYFDWNVSSGDTGNITSQEVYANVTAGLKNKTTCVVLMHDRHGNERTVDALRDIIRYGKSHGFKFDRITMDTPQIHHKVAN